MTYTAAGTLASNAAAGLTTLAHTNNASGNCLVLGMTITSLTITVSSVTGGGANKWVKVAGSSNDGTRSQELWMGTVNATGAQTITVNFSSTNAGLATDLCVQEFSSSLGAAAVWTWDSFGFLNNGASTTVTWPTLTPRNANTDLYVGHARVPSAGTFSALTAGFTGQTDVNGNPYIYGLAVTGSVSPTQTDSLSAANACQAVLIRDTSFWTVVQSAKATTSGTTVAATFATANVQAGNKIIAYVSVGATGAPALVSVKDAALNTWTQVGNSNQANGRVYIYALDVPSGDVGTKPTITATATSTPGLGIIIQEVSGLLAGNTTAMCDGAAGTLTGTAASTGNPTYTATAQSEFVVSAYGDFGTGNTVVIAADWTAETNNINTSTNSNCMVQYKNSTGVAEVDGFTSADTGGWAVAEIAFKLGVPTPTPVGQQLQPGSRTWRWRHRRVQQPIQPAFAAPALNVTAGLATAIGQAGSPGAAHGTVTGFTSVAGNAVPGLFTAGTPDFPAAFAFAQIATAVAVAQTTAFALAQAGLATAEGGAPLWATYTSLYGTVYGAQLTGVSTVTGTSAPAQVATATGIAQQTAGHNAQAATGTGAAPPFGMAQAQVATAIGAADASGMALAGLATATGTAQQAEAQGSWIATAIGAAPAFGMAQAGLATGTGAAAPFGMAQAQLATATGTAQQAEAQGSWLATAIGGAQQTAGHNTQVATATGTAQQAEAQGSWPATATGTSQQAEAQGSWIATATGTAQNATVQVAVNAPAQVATGIGAAPPFGEAQAQLATAIGAAQQPTVQTSGNTNAPAQVATATGIAQQAEAQGSWIATAAGAAPAFGMAQAQVASAAGTAQANGQGGWPATAVGTAQQAEAQGSWLATATGAAPAFGMAQAQLATGAGAGPPFGMAQAQLATATGTAQQATVSTSSNTNAPAQVATGTGAAQQAEAQGSWLASAAGAAQQTAGHNAQVATGTGAAPAFGMGMAGLATATGTSQNATILFGTNAPAGLAAATGFADQPAGHNAQLATAIATALQAVGSGAAAVVKGHVVTAVTGSTRAAVVTGKTNGAVVTGKTSAGTVTDPRDGTTKVTGKAMAGSVT